MGKGANVAPGDRLMTWEEVKRHQQKTDKWIVINNNIYDITEWAGRHPGGSRVISHYAGQDASAAFRAFHNHPDFVGKYLKAIHIGRLTPSESQVADIDKDFGELRDTAEKMGLFTPSVTFFTLTLFHIFFFEVLCYLNMWYFGTSWLPYLVSVALYTIVQAQDGWVQHDFGHRSVFHNTTVDTIFHYLMFGHVKGQSAWNQHDFGHLSVFKSTALNHLVHQLTMNHIKGACSDWWNHLHYQHHAKPNVNGKDPDVRLDAIFVLGEDQPKKVAKERERSMPYNWQHKYFFIIGPPLLFPIYFQYMVFRHAITRRKWVDLAWMISFYIKFFGLYIPMLGLFGCLKFYFIIRCLESHWFVWVSQSNHIPMEIKDDQERPWLSLQLHATCNVQKSAFNDWFTGHLNFQIEHHLFPTMPRHNLYKIAPLVKSLCAKHNIPYMVKPLSTAFADVIRSLKHSGQLWAHYYEAYHLH